jgi:diguanylate cyclase (GGDEF)-like protein/putative nucleotidyltransferase with HDIG domain
MVATIAWVPVSYYHFVRAYNNRDYGVGLYLGYTFVITFLILSLRGFVVQYAFVTDGVLFHDIGSSLYILGGVSAFFLFRSVSMLLKRYRTSFDPVDRNRTIYLLTGSMIAIGATYIVNFIPAISGLSIDHIGNIANALLITYAIMRYQLLNVRFVARKVLAYSLLVAALGGIYAASFLLGQQYFPNQSANILIIRTTAVIVLLAFLIKPLLNRIENGIDRFVYRKTYQYRRALFGFSRRMRHIINLNELASEMLTIVTKALHLTQAKLLFQDFNSGDFTVQFSYPKLKNEATDEITFSVDNPIVTWLNRENEPLNLQPIDNMPEFKGLWEAEKQQITASNLGLLCPIKSQDRLVGILALGEKETRVLYSHEDLELAINMARQAGAIIENAKLYSQAIAKANTDWLTGLYNHRHFHERLDQEIARGSRFGTTFSLIMMDIDLFKAYNDIHGHLAGDEILRRIGAYLKSTIRSLDTAFRYGGEEFAILLPEARLNDALGVAERIRKLIASKTSSRATPITASLGISNWPIDGVMKEEIISAADTALYRAKQTGRNRTCLSSDVMKPATPMVEVELEAQSRALSIIYALAATVDAKDHYTYGHSKKVSEYAIALVEAMGLPKDKVDVMRAAGLLHDIGKVGIPDSTLNKKGTLTDKEWELVRDHPKLGVEILRHVVDLVNCLPVILHHHEHYDGSGYPAGLKADNIPLESRILSIADAFDAITSPRPYRKQLSSQEAIEEIKRCAGTQFDPKLVEVFCKMIEPVPSKT